MGRTDPPPEPAPALEKKRNNIKGLQGGCSVKNGAFVCDQSITGFKD
jgi:hypothetical protein